jgi:hypothetical protein
LKLDPLRCFEGKPATHDGTTLDRMNSEFK